MRLLTALWAIVCQIGAVPALAGAPFETDDAQVLGSGHWEVLIFSQAEGIGNRLEGSAGLDFTYGLTKFADLTVVTPINFNRGSGDPARFGDIEVATKFRLSEQSESSIAVAVVPAIVLPTASGPDSFRKVRAFLPIWLEKSWKGWSLISGGGYTINPGAGNRDYPQAHIAIIRQANERLSIGIEAKRQGPDSVGGRPTTLLGAGASLSLGGPASLLVSAGPTFVDDQTTRWHVFSAIQLGF
jgi:hypothetical protein